MNNIFNQLIAVKESLNTQLENSLNVSIDPEMDSYFEENKYPEQSYFSSIDTSNVESLKNELSRVIGIQLEGFPPEIYKKLAELAFELKSIDKLEEGALSEAAYVMF